MAVFVFNRDLPAAANKFKMMKSRLAKRYNVGSWVSLHQDNEISGVWNALADYWIEDTGPFYNLTSKFVSKRNDMYLVDQWGRMIRFLRDSILYRARKTSAENNLLWRNVIHDVMLATKERRTVCDELQYERIYCRISEEWQLDGVRFRDLRQRSVLTILVFIRADMTEFTVDGLLRDLTNLSKRWTSPRYLAVADSVPQSKARFAAVRSYLLTRNSAVRLLQDENNKVASKYMAAPGDLFAIDSL